jgi:dienelactone hydrolase
MNDAAHLTPMTHTPVRFGADNALVGMVTAPAGQAPAAVACLMFNMGANHRVGPRRINVKLAHALAARGVSSLRFDLGGIGDSDAPADAAGLSMRALRDLQAGMDLLQNMQGIGQFAIVGMCSGAEHAMAIAAVDARVIGLSLFDGYAFPQRRTRWERTLRRALAAPAHPSFAGKTQRWLKRRLLRSEAAKPMPGFFTEEASPAETQAWFGKTMALLAERQRRAAAPLLGIAACVRPRPRPARPLPRRAIRTGAALRIHARGRPHGLHGRRASSSTCAPWATGSPSAASAPARNGAARAARPRASPAPCRPSGPRPDLMNPS